jgi:hypothetical protein
MTIGIHGGIIRNAPACWLGGTKVREVLPITPVVTLRTAIESSSPLFSWPICNATWLADSRQHERVHVRQYELWGPLFIPAYMIAGLWATVNGRPAYAENYFEREARRAEAAGCRIG